MEQIIGLKELRQKMDDYAKEVKKGRSFVVVKQSKPLFKIVPFDSKEDDDGGWETVMDFTKIKKGGISAGELLKRLRKLNREN